MMPLKLQAIQTALLGDWSNAILLNQELLKENPDDIDTLNRLAYAYSITGKIKEAKKSYRRVLEIDGQNLIAIKNLKRLTESNNGDFDNSCVPSMGQIGTMFLEETGKTKVIELVNLANSKIIAHLTIGELLSLCIKRLKIFILNGKKEYVGMLPDDVGKRLIKFIKGGNLYEGYIKAVESHRVVIFIKEVKKSAKFINQPSFISYEKTKNIIAHKRSHAHASEDSSQDVE